MPRRVIVLKFGGSVLASPESLSLAVHEIYRWRREGWSVLAVVSAFSGETDALLREAIERGSGACRHVLAAAIGQGETRSASQLGLLLERSGVPAAVVNPGAIGLRGTGDPLDADPCSVDTDALLRLFAEDRVVVCPGFVATDDTGRWLLLGRGGSDLTALYLTAELRTSGKLEAKCRLIKDVDGLYDREPKAGPTLPDRYASASRGRRPGARRLDHPAQGHRVRQVARPRIRDGPPRRHTPDRHRHRSADRDPARAVAPRACRAARPRRGGLRRL